MFLEYFFDLKKIKKFENILRQNGYRKDFPFFLKESTAIGAGFFVAAIFLLAFAGADFFFISIVPLVCFGL